MKYNELQSRHKSSPKRVGRGIAAGQGKTAGRGTKGQGARTGSSKKPGFEGGQNPLMQRLPKLHGFRSYRVAAENVFTEQLNDLGATVTNETLAEKGLVSSPYVRVKLLKRGDLTKKVNVNLQAASGTAIEAVQKAGGTFTKATQVGRPVTKKPKSEKK
jgi:large subunit ribosomal protein L15